MTTHSLEISPSLVSANVAADPWLAAAMLVARQLERESRYLDAVLDFTAMMNDSLLQRRAVGFRQATPNVSTATDGALSQPSDAIQKAYHALAEQFAPVAQGRQAMLTALSTLKGMPSGTVSISRLTSRLSPPLREELHHLRNTVKAKILDIQAMIMGNQAILMYTMDFYGRLLTSLTGELEPAQAYNARGQLSSSSNASIVKQQC